MPTFDQLLSRVVERKGYTIQGADREGLLARRGDEMLLVAWKTDAPVTPADASIFTTALDQIHASAGILLAARGLDAAAKDALAARKDVEVWPESRIVIELGEAFLRDALDAHAQLPAAPAPAAMPQAAVPQTRTAQPKSFPSLVGRAASASSADTRGAAYYMPNKPKAQAPPAQAQSGASLRYAWGGAAGGVEVHSGVAQIRNGRKPQAAQAPAQPSSTIIVPENDDVEIISTPRKGAAKAAPAPAAPAPEAPRAPAPAVTEAYEIITSKPKKAAASADAPAAATSAGSDTLKAAVQKADAEAKAAAKVGAIKQTKLALVPHIAFEFDACIERPQLPAPITGKGAVLVSSLTGELRQVSVLDWAEAAPADARKDAPKLQAVDVYDKVKGHLGKQFGKELKVEREVGGTTVMENLKISPGPEELGLNHRGIVYVPVWEIGGANGAAKVDGLTGNVV